VLPQGPEVKEGGGVLGLQLEGALQQGLAQERIAAPAVHDRQTFEPIGILRTLGQMVLQQRLGPLQIPALSAERASLRSPADMGACVQAPGGPATDNSTLTPGRRFVVPQVAAGWGPASIGRMRVTDRQAEQLVVARIPLLER
jgi:hypothetical protein